MRTNTLKRQRSNIRRAQIKKAVLDIISEEGLHSISARNVAKRVGITDGAIFRHFKSKREIIKSIMTDVETELIEDLRSIVDSADGAEDRLYRFLYTHITYLVEHRGIAVLLFSEAAHLNFKQLRNQLRSILTEQKSMISKIIRDGVKEGTWRKKVNIDDASNLYMGILVFFNVKLFLTEKSVGVENYCKRMFNLMSDLLT